MEDKKPLDETRGKQIQINIDKDKIESKYSDLIFVSTNPMGLTFDFGQNIPQMKMIKVIQRISMSPQHAKAFLGVLQKNIENYEKQFGSINITPAMQEQVDKDIGFKVEEKK